MHPFKLFLPTLCLGLASLGSPAQAADPYANLGLGTGMVFENSQTTSLVLRGGTEINRWFAVEAEGQIGLDEERRENRFGDISTGRQDYLIAAYAVGKIPLGESAEIFLRTGYGVAKATDEFERTDPTMPLALSETETVSGVTFGLGAQFMFGETRRNGVRLDAYSLIDINEGEEGGLDSDTAVGLTLAYVRKF